MNLPPWLDHLRKHRTVPLSVYGGSAEGLIAYVEHQNEWGDDCYRLCRVLFFERLCRVQFVDDGRVRGCVDPAIVHLVMVGV